MLTLYNTLTRKLEGFKPLKGKTVGIYSCGPTVYAYPHIGNYRAYIFVDLLKRYLLYRGYKVKHIMNITDVDDKTIRNSQKEGVSLKEFTSKYEKAFFEDLEALNIIPADKFPRATDYIKEMVAITKALMRKGIAYRGDDGSIYYDIGKFKDYGKLANIDTSKLKAGASGRVKKDEYSKDDVQDFALWKAYDKADGNVFWETSIGGRGRPGWHVECSAMSMEYLGKTFDIHCGGVDLIFPHNQNEIAQSEGWTGKKFVNYWLHNEWLLVNGQKMSKSLGNFYTLRDVLAKGFPAVAIRYLLSSTHYRQQLNFTFEGIDAAKASVERLNELIRKLQSVKSSSMTFLPKKVNQKIRNSVLIEKEIASAEAAFEKAMDDDLNISEALAAVFELVKSINPHIDNNGIDKKSSAEALKFLEKVDSVLGVMSFEKEERLPQEISRLIEQREKLRQEKKFAEADKIRAQLREKGIQLDDTPEGVRWKKIR
ncbi:cysteine--tRNA ligase [Candidatus Woesearchaeota archaeon]|nr:cysteine--tRNA ligase [Candidatus Woesearchaeota archaeon]